MKITRSSTLPEIAAVVSGALRKAGITAILTGGACAAIHSNGAYMSKDLDFIIRQDTTQSSLDAAMAAAGFSRDGDRYVHPATPFYVEFPPGPLAIGDDLAIRPVTIRLPAGSATTLSATDSCRDRLAAFYHWSDRQSLEVAVEIAARRRVDVERIRVWSLADGFPDKLSEFLTELARRRHRPAAAPRRPRR